MKKIIKSGAMIVAVGAIVVGVTMSFFSDEETSNNNMFTAGALDLQIDDTCHYNGMVCGEDGKWADENGAKDPVETPWAFIGGDCDCTWSFDEWEDGNALLSFNDLKPGDWGENTLSFHIDNPAWACLLVDTVVDDDNDCTEPEALAEGNACEDQDGELDENMEYQLWWDKDCDNVYDAGEEYMVDQGNLGDVGGAMIVPIADNSGQSLVSGPVDAGKECVGIGWNIPEDAGNEMQTDSLGARLKFYVEQARHNETFECSQLGLTPVERHISLENKTAGDWQIIADDQTYGDIHYSHNDTTFHGVVTGAGLVPNAYYQITLNGPGSCTTTDHNLAGNGSSANLFAQGYWTGSGSGLSNSCTGNGEGVYNMDLQGDHYTVETDGAGAFTHNFDFALPAGDYSGVKVLVKKMLDDHVSPWTDTTGDYPTFNLYETAAISFTVL